MQAPASRYWPLPRRKTRHPSLLQAGRNPEDQAPKLAHKLAQVGWNPSGRDVPNMQWERFPIPCTDSPSGELRHASDIASISDSRGTIVWSCEGRLSGLVSINHDILHAQLAKHLVYIFRYRTYLGRNRRVRRELRKIRRHPRKTLQPGYVGVESGENGNAYEGSEGFKFLSVQSQSGGGAHEYNNR